MRAAQDNMLAEASQHLFESVLQMIGDSVPWERGGHAAGQHGIGHVASRAGWRKMPTLIT